VRGTKAEEKKRERTRKKEKPKSLHPIGHFANHRESNVSIIQVYSFFVPVLHFPFFFFFIFGLVHHQPPQEEEQPQNETTKMKPKKRK
jgi:hypothetical protein